MTTLKAALEELDAKAKRSSLIPLPDDALLDKYEKEIGFKFPPDYRELLKRENNVIFGTKEIFIVRDVSKKYPELSRGVEHAKAYGVPGDWLPICMDNSNFYCLTPAGDVKFWSHDAPFPPYESWPSLADWIKDVWIDGK